MRVKARAGGGLLVVGAQSLLGTPAATACCCRPYHGERRPLASLHRASGGVCVASARAHDAVCRPHACACVAGCVSALHVVNDVELPASTAFTQGRGCIARWQRRADRCVVTPAAATSDPPPSASRPWSGSPRTALAGGPGKSPTPSASPAPRPGQRRARSPPTRPPDWPSGRQRESPLRDVGMSGCKTEDLGTDAACPPGERGGARLSRGGARGAGGRKRTGLAGDERVAVELDVGGAHRLVPDSICTDDGNEVRSRVALRSGRAAQPTVLRPAIRNTASGVQADGPLSFPLFVARTCITRCQCPLESIVGSCGSLPMAVG